MYRERHVFEPACKQSLFRGQAVVLDIFFAHGCQTIVFQPADKVFLVCFLDMTHVFFGRKPDVDENPVAVACPNVLSR